MLRTSDKRLFVSGRLLDVMGGRQVFAPSYLRSAVLPPVSGYTGWWDGADAASITSAAGVMSQWNDKSGNGYHFTQSTAANKPIYSAGTVNGIVVPEFDGNRWMQSSCPAWADMSQTIFIVAVISAAGAGAIRTLLATGTTSQLQFRVSSAGKIETLKSGVATLATLDAATITATQQFCAISRIQPASVEHRLNGVSETDAHAQSFTGTSTLRIGGRNGLTESMHGYLAEVVIYDSILSSTDTAAVESYLRGKWATP